jgi:glycosyltransferase involved in cell wall biosynthesis
VDQFTLRAEKEDFYLTASRFVPYKRIDLIVEAFSKMPSKQLIVIGEGPDFKKVKANAGPNVQLLGYQPSEVLKDYMQRAKAFVFAAEEDFGITPIEAQACGTPVIAYGKGGVLETIRGLETSNPTGVFFQEQTVESIIDGVERFEQRSGVITATACRENAMRFSSERFRNEFRAFIEEKVTSMTNPVDILNYKRQMD